MLTEKIHVPFVTLYYARQFFIRLSEILTSQKNSQLSEIPDFELAAVEKNFSSVDNTYKDLDILVAKKEGGDIDVFGILASCEIRDENFESTDEMLGEWLVKQIKLAGGDFVDVAYVIDGTLPMLEPKVHRITAVGQSCGVRFSIDFLGKVAQDKKLVVTCPSQMLSVKVSEADFSSLSNIPINLNRPLAAKSPVLVSLGTFKITPEQATQGLHEGFLGLWDNSLILIPWLDVHLEVSIRSLKILCSEPDVTFSVVQGLLHVSLTGHFHGRKIEPTFHNFLDFCHALSGSKP